MNNCDQTGHFQSRDIPPGQYVAGVLIPNFGGVPNRSNVTKVSVDANERVTLSFKVPPNSLGNQSPSFF
jgi:hypothetical protein